MALTKFGQRACLTLAFGAGAAGVLLIAPRNSQDRRAGTEAVRERDFAASKQAGVPVAVALPGEPPLVGRYHVASELLAGLGQRGSEGALERLRAFSAAWSLVPQHGRSELLRRFLAGLDLYASCLEAREIPGLLSGLAGAVADEMLFPLQRVLFRRLASHDPHTAVVLAESLPAGFTRETMQIEIALAWADVDLPGAATWLARWPEGPVRDIAVKTMGGFLADTDPQKASAWIATLPHNAITLALFEGLLSQGGGRAFEAALAWTQNLPDGPEKQRALVHLSYQWAKRDFAAALVYAQGRPPGDDVFTVVLVNQWAQRDPRSAADWAATLPDGIRRQRIMASLTATWAQRDPRAAAEFVLLRLQPGPTQEQAAASIVSAWATQDPRAAAQWLEGFPTGSLRNYAIETLIHPWATRDPAGAMAWLTGLPAGPARETALNTGFARLIESQPHLAAEWAAKIGNETLRHQKSERAARAWLALDLSAARNWIVASSLPASAKQRLLQASLQ